jgi:hypothetical protein
MKIIELGRAEGKTTAIIRWFLENPKDRVIVAVSAIDGTHLAKLVDKAWLMMSEEEIASGRHRSTGYHFWTTSGRIITFMQLQHDFRGVRGKEIAFDNLDTMLMFYVGVGNKVVLATITKEDE